MIAVGELARKYGAVWIIDETHTISVGPGGMTADLGLKPDILTIGKAIGGGIPTGTFGMTHDIAAQIAKKLNAKLLIRVELVERWQAMPYLLQQCVRLLLTFSPKLISQR